MNDRIGLKLLTLDDLSEILNTSKAQVYALVRSGELPGMKMGGRGQWRVHPDKVTEYIEKAHEETAQWIKENPFSRHDSEATAEAEASSSDDDEDPPPAGVTAKRKK